MANNKYEEECGYIGLANAIVAQAADDYRVALGMYKRACDALESMRRYAGKYDRPQENAETLKSMSRRINGAVKDIEILERFFNSKWCADLTQGANIKYILRQLRKEFGINDIYRH